MKLAMIKLPLVLAEEKCSAHFLLQVHDELVLETPRKELKETTRIVQQVMENAYQLSIPLETEAKYGKNWGAMEPVTD